jgi:cobalamin biosynthesis protein CobW
MTRKIPATIVTGFLGSGKTTLLRHVIGHAKGRRIAVIVNEFGDQGFDGDLLADCGDEDCAPTKLVELTNGCICCTVADDFQPALEAVLATAPDHIVIETSGLALPKPLVKAFDWPAIRSRVTVDGVIVVVDGPAAASGLFAETIPPGESPEAHDFPLAEVFEDQVALADLVILNKREAMTEAEAAEVRALIAGEVKRPVPIVETSRGQIAPEVILGLGAAAEDDLANRPTHHDAAEAHDHDDFDSIALDLPVFPSAEAAVAALSAIVALPGVLRAKGFAEIAGKPLRLMLQAVGRRIESHFDHAPPGVSARRLVVIGLKGFDAGAATRALAPVSQAA